MVVQRGPFIHEDVNILARKLEQKSVCLCKSGAKAPGATASHPIVQKKRLSYDPAHAHTPLTVVTTPRGQSLSSYGCGAARNEPPLVVSAVRGWIG